MFKMAGDPYRGRETSVTRTIALLALGCTLIASAAALSIVTRNDGVAELAGTESANHRPVANRTAKTDRLAVMTVSTNAAESAAALAAAPEEVPLRQAFAADTPLVLPKPVEAAAAMVPVPEAKPDAKLDAKLEAKPKAASKPPVQKTYALLSDSQIAAIKSRLNLSSSQAYYWPSVEQALRAVARKMHATQQANPKGAAPAIDPDSEEVQQLKSAAMPLLFQLREDQKQEVRSLARIIGLHQVAAAI